MERRARLKDKFIKFSTTYRMTQGLHEPSSTLWYGRTLKPDSSCALANRPKSQQFMEYMSGEYAINSGVPRLVLNLANGVSLKRGNGSRYNLHNVALALREIHKILSRAVFTPGEICIETPYRAQAALYRAMVAKASRTEDWQGLDALDLRVNTVDSLQGDESRLIVL